MNYMNWKSSNFGTLQPKELFVSRSQANDSQILGLKIQVAVRPNNPPTDLAIVIEPAHNGTDGPSDRTLPRVMQMDSQAACIGLGVDWELVPDTEDLVWPSKEFTSSLGRGSIGTFTGLILQGGDFYLCCDPAPQLVPYLALYLADESTLTAFAANSDAHSCAARFARFEQAICGDCALENWIPDTDCWNGRLDFQHASI